MTTEFDNAVAALELAGLYLGAEDCPIKNADDLAMRVETAARNRKAGRRKRAQEKFDEGAPVNLDSPAHAVRPPEKADSEAIPPAPIYRGSLPPGFYRRL